MATAPSPCRPGMLAADGSPCWATRGRASQRSSHRRAGEGAPAAAPLDEAEPAAQLVAGEPRVVPQVDGGEASEAGGQPQARRIDRLDPLVDEGDALVVLVDADDRRLAQPRSVG